jgi:WD40 repeat protein
MSCGGKDGKFLAVTSEDGLLYIFDIIKKRHARNIKIGSGGVINCVKWHKNSLVVGNDEGLV